MSKVKSKITKLHLLNQMWGSLSNVDKLKCRTHFNKAANNVMGEAWTQGGYSIESGVELEYYLRGIMSKEDPIVINSDRLMRGLAKSLAVTQHSATSFESQSEFGKLLCRKSATNHIHPKVLSRLGFEEESHEVLGSLLLMGGLFGLAGAAKLSEWLTKNKKERQAKEKAAADAKKQLDPKDIKSEDFKRIPAFLSKNLNNSIIDASTQVEGNVAGGDIVKRLTWGHQFDQKDPVGFLTRMMNQYQTFYTKYQNDVIALNKTVLADEKSTRPAVMAVKDDKDKVEEVLKAATGKLEADFNKVHAFYGNSKVSFPNARRINPASVKDQWNRSENDPEFKAVGEIRTLTKDEVKKLVNLLSTWVGDVSKFDKIYECGWSDHSDGDPFWDVAEYAASFDDYCGYIYHQTCDNALIYYVDDYAEVFSSVALGVLAWIEASLKPGKETAESNESRVLEDMDLSTSRFADVVKMNAGKAAPLLKRLEKLYALARSNRNFSEPFYAVIGSWEHTFDKFGTPEEVLSIVDGDLGYLESMLD